MGLLAGGACTATALWLVSGLATPIPAVVRHGVLVLAAVVFLARDAGWWRFPMPQNTRQVPQDVMQRHLIKGSLQFGFEMGTSVRTYVSASAPYVVGLALLLAGLDYWSALLVGLGFGLGRAATPLSRLTSTDGIDWDARLIGRLPVITVGTCLVLAAVFTILWLRV
ncbi:hypothetical protein FB566_4064 [Stackebrandtia endophytica]|uniref:Uncharacterized protein n=1 Tax=Stackebrandtia endophytica TaxID=1496996 RepID=A0A543B103_9ACTN|nr:hypothetical protein [Stackebrandtia endophytica]TQL78476.1 hypothetical protein FB566_4064 [Stackebrandtia endophytica]